MAGVAEEVVVAVVVVAAVAMLAAEVAGVAAPSAVSRRSRLPSWTTLPSSRGGGWRAGWLASQRRKAREGWRALSCTTCGVLLKHSGRAVIPPGERGYVAGDCVA